MAAADISRCFNPDDEDNDYHSSVLQSKDMYVDPKSPFSATLMGGRMIDCTYTVATQF